MRKAGVRTAGRARARAITGLGSKESFGVHIEGELESGVNYHWSPKRKSLKRGSVLGEDRVRNGEYEVRNE